MKLTATYPLPPSSPNIPRYRYFFNGQETDNEAYGNGCFQNYGFRMYDTRLGRFWGVDPLTKDYPMLTPFQFASNTPIWAIDLDGLEAVVRTTRTSSYRRPVYFRETNNYARTEYGRLPSVRNTTTTRYQLSSNNGIRVSVSTPQISYLETFHSPQGNNIIMSANNIQARTATLLGDLCQVFITNIENNINTPQGIRTNTNTKITFVEVQKQVEFDRLQLAYESLFENLMQQLPDPELSFSVITNPVAQELFRQAEKTRQAKDILGPSPVDMLNRMIMNCEKTVLSQEQKTIMLPEIRPDE